MSDPVIERIKREVSEEFDAPLEYVEKFLEQEHEKVHLSRRHGLLEDLRKLTAQHARSNPGDSAVETEADSSP